MKTCLLCNTDSPDDAATCPNDGEASWGGSPPVAAVTVPEVTEASDEAEPAKKRSRR